jgi:hypothetical protein
MPRAALRYVDSYAMLCYAMLCYAMLLYYASYVRSCLRRSCPLIENQSASEVLLNTTRLKHPQASLD